MNRNELVDRCKAIIVEAYEEATEMIVAYLELHPNESEAGLCKEIDPENWNALRNRVQRAKGNRKSPGGANPSSAQSRRRAKKLLRHIPEAVAELTPAEQREIAKVLDRESAKRQTEREKISDEKFRETMGDETADGLEFAQALTDTAWYLTKANQDLASFLKRANEIGVDDAPDRWRNRCLESIEWAEAKLGMAKALLQSDEIDWTAFEDMLGKEVN